MLNKLNSLIVLSLNIVWILAAPSSDFPGIPSCSEKDQNVNECLKKVFQEMIPRAKNGIPELNIPPIEPFSIRKTSYVFSHNIIQGKITVTNLKIHGLSNLITDSVDYQRNGNRTKFIMKSRIPKIFVEGGYQAKMQLNTARISSKGPFNVTLTDIDVTVTSEGELEERDGHVYSRLVKYNFDPTVGNMKFSAEGLMPDPLLNEAILEFINQNWRSIYKTLIPETRAAWEPELIKLGNEYFSHVPIDAVLSRD